MTLFILPIFKNCTFNKSIFNHISLMNLINTANDEKRHRQNNTNYKLTPKWYATLDVIQITQIHCYTQPTTKKETT